MSENTILKINATQKPETAKPGTTQETRSTIRALIAKVNKPRVKKVIGKVRINIKGLIKALTIPKTKAATKVAQSDTITTDPGQKPFIKYAVIIIAKVETSQFKINFIRFIKLITINKVSLRGTPKQSESNDQTRLLRRTSQ